VEVWKKIGSDFEGAEKKGVKVDIQYLENEAVFKAKWPTLLQRPNAERHLTAGAAAVMRAQAKEGFLDDIPLGPTALGVYTLSGKRPRHFRSTARPVGFPSRPARAISFFLTNKKCRKGAVGRPRTSRLGENDS